MSVSPDVPNLLRAYGIIDAASKTMGFTMGKNDLWIAATAHVTGAALLTTDRDFDHLDPDYLTREWIAP
ncbi:MAG TPA: PIN domain-containing protein [Armatimonadaceae bacterium]|nr:PIN domain-containing protein [Armatimonadaceae bacterium]